MALRLTTFASPIPIQPKSLHARPCRMHLYFAATAKSGRQLSSFHTDFRASFKRAGKKCGEDYAFSAPSK